VVLTHKLLRSMRMALIAGMASSMLHIRWLLT
jgi:hypothetical protein